jgi:hypothetical protein
MTSSPIPSARSQHLLDLLAQVLAGGRNGAAVTRWPGCWAVGIAAVIAGSRSFAAIGHRAADAGPEVLAGLGAARGPGPGGGVHVPARIRHDRPRRARPGPWHLALDQCRAVSGRLVIAVDGKAVRGAKNKTGVRRPGGCRARDRRLHTQHDTAKAALARHADYVMTVKGNMPTLHRQLRKLPWTAVPPSRQ